MRLAWATDIHLDHASEAARRRFCESVQEQADALVGQRLYDKPGKMAKVIGRLQPSRTATTAVADLSVDYGSGIMEDSVAASLKEMGICVAPMRTLLIQTGYFVGHKYRFDGGYAIRFVGKSEVEIYDDDGKMPKTVSLVETDKKDAA